MDKTDLEYDIAIVLSVLLSLGIAFFAQTISGVPW